ncbi:MAG: PilZ domain-containing protein [Candidatus Omnitrophica bacterium]|nr:PilZ domain-containing protein [Candidatus Omnitrophota bacterium]
MDSSLIEKRRWTRIPSKVAISYKISNCSSHGKSTTLDISEGGVRAAFENYLTPCTPICLELNLNSEIIYASGQVVWSQRLPHADRYNSGIQFIGMNVKERSNLREFILLNS